jgi:hypothetical protein
MFFYSFAPSKYQATNSPVISTTIYAIANVFFMVIDLVNFNTLSFNIKHICDIAFYIVIIHFFK